MLNRRSFFPSILGGLSAAVAIPKLEEVGYQRLTVDVGGGRYSLCVRLAKSELQEYGAWLVGLCAFATLVKSVDEASPQNPVSFAEAKEAITEPAQPADRCPSCGWCDEPDEDGSCYNCGE